LKAQATALSDQIFPLRESAQRAMEAYNGAAAQLLHVNVLIGAREDSIRAAGIHLETIRGSNKRVFGF
jgi:hypothetical protein